MHARDLMTSNPTVVTPTDRIVRAAEFMRDLHVGCIPVVDDPTIPVLLGILTDRDIAVRCVAAGHGTNCKVSEHMTCAPLATVTPEADAGEVIEKMERHQVRRIPVVDNSGTLVGIIAQADLATKLGPTDPLHVEEVLQRVSAPDVALT